MSELIGKLRTPSECEQFAKNVATKHPDWLPLIRLRAVELRAAEYGAASAAEREAVAAVFAYEEVLSANKGRRIRASRIWQMIDRYGILEAVERAVSRPNDPVGYTALVGMGLQEYAFEAVVLRYPHLISETAVVRCRERLREWRTPDTSSAKD